jgi:nucleoside-diphosphate-sugar epimerase
MPATNQGGRFLVTGGAGFIGSNLASILADQGHPVRILDNFSTGRAQNLAELPEAVEVVRADVRDPDAVRGACRDVEYVLHLAALPSVARSVEDPVATHDVNITGTLNLLLQARDTGVRRVVFASSSSVYGDTPVLPKHEDMPPSPLSPYALSKLAGEQYCRLFYELYGLETFALRYFNVYGPRQDPASDYAAVIPAFIARLRAGESPVIHGDGGQTRDFTFVSDVAAANLCCCHAPAEAAGQVYNVARGDRTSILELAQTIADILETEVQPAFTEARAGDVRDSQADAERARAILGWVPAVTLDDGLRRTVEWFARAGGAS